MPELSAEGVEDWPGVLKMIHDSHKQTFKWLKDLRQPKEEEWAQAQAYYDNARELAEDGNRTKSVNYTSQFDDPNAEMGVDRLNLLLPQVYEAVQFIGAHLYTRMRGNGPTFVEVIGREKNDIDDATRNEEFLNYQYSNEIPTIDVISDYIHNALVLGTGIRMQTWDAANNMRREEVLDNYDVWWDEAKYQSDIKVVCVRREISVGDLYKMRDGEQSTVWFSDSDMTATAALRIDHFRRTDGYTSGNVPFNTIREKMSTKQAGVDGKYQRVYLDIMMHTEPEPRWVLVVNEQLVIGVWQPQIFDDPSRQIKHTFPITTFAPVRKTGEIHGDSFVSRMLGSQDMCNSLLELLTVNIKSAVLGIGITGDEELAGQEIVAGQWHHSHRPEGTQILHPAVNATQLLEVIDWLTSRATDKISGLTPEVRGQAQFSGMPATAIRDLMQQGATRLSPIEDRALTSMQSSFKIALTLNKLYLQPHDFFRVVGEEGMPLNASMGDGQQSRPIEAKDFTGTAGVDLVPTGFPGSNTSATQEALNEAAVVQQMNGDGVPLMRLYFENKYKGRLDVNEIFPQNSIGNDPFQENENIINGVPVSRDPDDNDARHYQVHLSMFEDPRVMQMIQQNPLLGMVAQTHVQAHIQFMMQNAALMAGSQPQAGGGGGSGASGINMNMPTATPKSDADRESQMKKG